MPQFTPIETLDDGCVLGTSISRNNRTWYVRMYGRTGKSAVYKSTKIAYEDSVASKRNAKRKAKTPIHLIRGGRSESYWTHEKVVVLS